MFMFSSKRHKILHYFSFKYVSHKFNSPRSLQISHQNGNFHFLAVRLAVGETVDIELDALLGSELGTALGTELGALLGSEVGLVISNWN
jgi:hypothetical protein